MIWHIRNYRKSFWQSEKDTNIPLQFSNDDYYSRFLILFRPKDPFQRWDGDVFARIQSMRCDQNAQKMMRHFLFLSFSSLSDLIEFRKFQSSYLYHADLCMRLKLKAVCRPWHWNWRTKGNIMLKFVERDIKNMRPTQRSILRPFKLIRSCGDALFRWNIDFHAETWRNSFQHSENWRVKNYRYSPCTMSERSMGVSIYNICMRLNCKHISFDGTQVSAWHWRLWFVSLSHK